MSRVTQALSFRLFWDISVIIQLFSELKLNCSDSLKELFCAE